MKYKTWNRVENATTARNRSHAKNPAVPYSDLRNGYDGLLRHLASMRGGWRQLLRKSQHYAEGVKPNYTLHERPMFIRI